MMVTSGYIATTTCFGESCLSENDRVRFNTVSQKVFNIEAARDAVAFGGLWINRSICHPCVHSCPQFSVRMSPTGSSLDGII